MNVSNLESPLVMNITSLGVNKKLNNLFRKYIRDELKREENRCGGLMGVVDDMDEVSNGNIKKHKNKK